MNFVSPQLLDRWSFARLGKHLTTRPTGQTTHCQGEGQLASPVCTPVRKEAPVSTCQSALMSSFFDSLQQPPIYY